MLKSGKWIDGIDADGSVPDAARRSLELRLTAVIQDLPLAAHLAEHDVEHVHRLRVASRRAAAALELYRDWLPRKPARWLKRRIKKIRRAAGDARDLDVFAAHLASDQGDRAEPVVAIAVKRRSEVQSAIVKVAERCRNEDRLVRKVGKLLDRIESQDQENESLESFRSWAAVQLADSAGSFFASAPGEANDLAALHQFRIRGKELRYTIELVAPAFGRELRKEHYPVIEELQERLGKVQDNVTAIAQLRDWAGDRSNSQTQEVLCDLAEEQRERLIEAVDDFRSWWTNDRAESLKTGLTQAVMLEEATEPTEAVHQT